MAGILPAVLEPGAYDPIVDGHLATRLPEPILANFIIDYGQLDLLQLIAKLLALLI